MGYADNFSQLLQEIAQDTISQKVVDYTCDQLAQGKTLHEIFENDYIKSRLNEAQRAKILSHPAIAEAELEEVRNVFRRIREDASL